MKNNESFYLEEPTIKRKQEVIELIKEFKDYNSEVAGSSFLDKKINNYENWLEFLEEIKNNNNENLCPGIQYFLIRKNDNKIVGLINIRYNLNDWMMKYGGHIGYSIRPTERNKGYSKINLYLALEKCQKLGLKEILITADDDNIASYKTIETFGGELKNKIKNKETNNIPIRRYFINVEKALSMNGELIKWDYHIKY